MIMKEVNFYRGLRRKYNKALYGDGIYFATDTKEIIVNDISYGSVDVDDELTELGKNPVVGSAIYKAIKDNVASGVNNAPYGASLELSAANNIYTIILRDKNGNKLSEIGPIIGERSDTVDISGLRVSRVGNQHLQVKGNQQALLGFSYDVWDDAGQSLGISGKAQLYSDQNYENLLEEKTIAVGDHNFDVTKYLSEGVLSNFYVKITTNTNKGEQSSTLFYTVRLVNLSITSNFAINTVTKAGNVINIPGSVTGIQGLKTVRAYLDGIEVNTVEVQGVTSNVNLSINTEGLNHGTHNIQVRADYEITDEYGTVVSTVYSNIVYYDVVVVEDGNNTPVFACRFDYENGDSLITGTPVVNATQYDLFNLEYYVYDTNSSRESEFFSENEAVGSNTFSDAASIIKYRYTTSGIKLCYFQCNGVVYDFAVNVAKSNYLIDEPTSSLSLYLDALGKSNTSSSRDSWTYGNVTSTFENFNWSGNGWTGNSLKLFNGSKVTVHHQPFKSASSGALAFTIRYKVSNVTNSDEVVISCTDQYGNGLTITAQEAKLKTQANEISTKFATDETYTIGFVSFPAATENSSEYGKNNSNMCYIYVDGVISGGALKSTTNEIYQIDPTDITLQASGCELEVYSMRAYTTELTDDQMFSCHLIDLVNSETIAVEYEQNDVLDLNGDITIDKVKGKIPYLLITGPSQTEGLTQFEYAAVQNNKDDKYNVDSLLYVDDKDPSFNFYCIPDKKNPQIRLQGTSSMGYPRKNYRIYLKDAALYLGCNEKGEGGELQSKPKYSMNADSAPVNCFCFKADFAESSSTHNTGTTGLVEEVFKNANDLTPPQEHVDAASYPYQVRTTVEGKPCLIFYRSSETDIPKFGGKFNFNNDKSTEDVFGFLDIPGYHDNEEYLAEMEAAAQKSLIFPEGFTECSYEDDDETVVVTKEEIIEMIGKNPTECWEFKNNTTLMGNFLEADFDKIDPDSSKGEYYWFTSWEARFPDEDGLNAAFEAGVKPYYLMNLAQWLVSTNTDQATNAPLGTSVTYNGTTYSTDTAAYRQAKFRAELSSYFDVNYLCSYYMITECLAAADQRVKNMMWTFWFDPNVEEHEIMGKMRCFPIFYDNDTILGLDNTGKIAINWDADENTKNGDSYAFAGHDSTVWVNLRATCQDYLEAAYNRLRNNNMTNQVMLKWYNTNQSDKYSERIYNKDSIWKYIVPSNIGVPVLENGVVGTTKYSVLAQMQGSRRAHRSWFINNRMDTFDAKYKGGSYQASEITWKGAIEVAADENIGLNATVSRNQYLGVVEATDYKAHQLIKPGETFEFALSDGKGTAQGDVFHLYGIKWLKELDLSNWGGYEYIYFVGTMPTLERLIIGGHRGGAPNIVPIQLGTSTPSLKYLDITNIPIQGIDLSNCIYLEELVATGTKLASVTLAQGCNLQTVYLPETFNNLQLIGLPKLTAEGINLEAPDNVVRLRVEGCENLNGLDLLNTLLSTGTSGLRFVRITDLNLSGNGDDLINYMNKGLGGLDSAGNVVNGKCKLIGTYKLTKLLDVTTYESLCAYFDELKITQPEYTIVEFNCVTTNPKKISNLDNSTGYNFSGTTYSPSGHISRVLDKRHSYMVKATDTETGEFSVLQLGDTDSTKYIDGAAATFDGTQGDYCMYEPHYWYKGINDHKNQKLYFLISSNDEKPKQAAGLKVTKSQCEEKTGYKVSTAAANKTEASAIIADANYNVYSYILPEDHKYKQYRVSSVAANNVGSVVVDKDGNVLSKLSQDGTYGMYDGSYLFGDLPEKAYKIYLTLKNSITNDYCLYLTESEDLEAIEPDWVEHKECFIGRVMSTLHNTNVVSGIFETTWPQYSWSGMYPEITDIPVAELCTTLTDRGTGYYPADYEVFKDMLNLAYLTYGGTDLQISYVGAGAGDDGQFYTYSKYFPNDINYIEYGIQDTTVNIDDDVAYESIYGSGLSAIYPKAATLLGYHQMFNRGTTVATHEYVTGNNKTYTNTRTKRSIKLNSLSTGNYSRFIMGGRYFDLFIASTATAQNNTGFCGYEQSINSGNGYLIIGSNDHGQGNTPAAYKLYTSASLDIKSSISLQQMNYLVRVLIVPNKINYCTTSEEFGVIV